LLVENYFQNKLSRALVKQEADFICPDEGNYPAGKRLHNIVTSEKQLTIPLTQII
jgi:hypothetical protein